MHILIPSYVYAVRYTIVTPPIESYAVKIMSYIHTHTHTYIILYIATPKSALAEYITM